MVQTYITDILKVTFYVLVIIDCLSSIFIDVFLHMHAGRLLGDSCPSHLKLNCLQFTGYMHYG